MSKHHFHNCIKNVILFLYGYEKPRLLCFFMTFFLIYVLLFLGRSKTSIIIFTLLIITAFL